MNILEQRQLWLVSLLFIIVCIPRPVWQLWYGLRALVIPFEHPTSEKK